MVVAVIGSFLVDQSVLDEGSDSVASEDELLSVLVGNVFASGVVSKPAVAGPFGVGSVESFVNLLGLFLGKLLICSLFNADSSEVPA